ncbi:MAG: PspC domain-containing protein [Nocardioidaceae bacterium]|nr:PspC domain-containing protein [Nocardioidaceae bacterium]
MTETPQSPPGAGPRVNRDEMRDISTLRRPADPMVAGVAAGLARHFDIDPILVRVLFAALTLFGGAGVFLYVVGWLTIPAEDRTHSAASAWLRRDPERVMVAGLAIASVVAVITMIGAIGFSAPNPAPVVIVSLAALIAVALFSRRSSRLDQTPPPAPAAADRLGHASAPSQGTAAPAGGTPLGGPAAPSPPPPAPPRERHSARLFWVTMAVIAIALGAIWFLDETVYDEVPLSVYPGAALGIVATALIVGAWYGRSRLLIVVGFVASLATIAAGIVGPGPHGERTYMPTTAAEVQAEYQHGVGRITVHLQNVADLEGLDGRTIDIEGTVGQIRLIVPTSLDATITADVVEADIDGAPSVQDLGDGDQQTVVIPTDDADPDVTINLDLRFGGIEVYRFDCPGSPASEGQITNEWIGDDREPAACN